MKRPPEVVVSMTENPDAEAWKEGRLEKVDIDGWGKMILVITLADLRTVEVGIDKRLVPWIMAEFAKRQGEFEAKSQSKK